MKCEKCGVRDGATVNGRQFRICQVCQDKIIAEISGQQRANNASSGRAYWRCKICAFDNDLTDGACAACGNARR